MDMNSILRKVLHNKKNNQFSITIPKKPFGINKKKVPKGIRLKEKDIIWEE